jgi:hypothetical protein
VKFNADDITDQLRPKQERRKICNSEAMHEEKKQNNTVSAKTPEKQCVGSSFYHISYQLHLRFNILPLFTSNFPF